MHHLATTGVRLAGVLAIITFMPSALFAENQTTTPSDTDSTLPSVEVYDTRLSYAPAASLYPRREAQIDSSRFSTYSPTLQHGIFLNLRMHFSEPLVLTTGARLSRYGYGGFTQPATDTNHRGVYEKSNTMIPYTALSYDFNAHHSVFFSYADIFSIQNAYTRELEMVNPSLGKNLELGWKNEYHDDLLNTSVGTSSVVYGEPRNFMLNLNARF